MPQEEAPIVQRLRNAEAYAYYEDGLMTEAANVIEDLMEELSIIRAQMATLDIRPVPTGRTK